MEKRERETKSNFNQFLSQFFFFLLLLLYVNIYLSKFTGIDNIIL